MSLPVNGSWQTPLPAEKVAAIVNLASSKPLKGWEELNRTIEADGGLDLRLVPFAAEMAILRYGRTRNSSKQSPLPGWLPQVAGELEQRVYLHGDNRDGWALGVLVQAAPEVGLRLCRQPVSESSDPVLEEALRQLNQQPARRRSYLSANAFCSTPPHTGFRMKQAETWNELVCQRCRPWLPRSVARKRSAGREPAGSCGRC